MLSAILIDILLLLLIWWIYRPTLNGPFLYDDLVILSGISLNPQEPIRPLHLMFRHIRSAWAAHKSLLDLFYMLRPLTRLSYDLDAKLSGLNPRDWHITNIVIHMSAVVVAHHLLLEWLHLIPAALGAAVFASHPLCTMAVGYIAGRSSALCAYFMLCTLYNCALGNNVWAALFAVCALLTKQEAVMLIPLIGGMLWLGLT